MGAFLSRTCAKWLGTRADRPALSYSHPLNNQHIRLLQFVRPKWYTFGLCAPRLIMTTHPLCGLPRFVALSYTWGDPHKAESNPMRPYEDEFTVHVNDQEALVLRNLWEALGDLLWLWNFEDDVQHIWIDAICINQLDLSERAGQVSVMDEIYRCAETTVVWLGKPTRHSKKARCLFDRICRIPSKELLPYYKEYPNGTPPPPEFWTNRGLPAIDDELAWKPLTEFFKHCWFDRAWIIQEVTLSTRNIHLFWGHNSMTWEELGHVSFVCHVGMIGKLETLPALSQYLAGSQLPEDSHDWAVSDPLVNTFQLWSNRQRYLAKSQNRGDDSMCDEMKALTGCSTPSAASWLLYFALMNRRANATDPRDKIFCNLGLVNSIVKQENLAPCNVHAGYSSEITSSRVYRQAMEDSLVETDNLAVLMAVNDPPNLRKADLPTWVPDFSRRHGLDLMWSIRPKFNASSRTSVQCELSPHSKRVIIDGCLLKVKCITLALATTMSVSLADLVGPQWYRWADDLLRMGPMYEFTNETSVEAFWRTLLMNSVARKHPAQWSGADNDSDMFHAFVLQSMIRHYPSPDSSISTEQYQDQLRCINELSKDDRTGCMPTFTGLGGLLSQITGISEENLTSASEAEIVSALAETSEKAARYVMGLDGSMVNRRLVISDRGHLVNAPLWVAASDTIAIIDSCPCPVVLRHHPEQRGLYTLVGTAYVHGVMHGEAIHVDTNWQQISIR
ncbi:Heterokaryon incompatibility protein [Paramyrothecium foliicola]|nr:Heterokaryon incompatibility protein [Paramyrothecium foliicola]